MENKLVDLLKEHLNEEEIEIFTLLASGNTQKFIASKLNMTRSTVCRRVKRIREKVRKVLKSVI